MKEFLTLREAFQWLSVASGPCTVIVHGDPYEATELDKQVGQQPTLTRKYPNDFYLRSHYV